MIKENLKKLREELGLSTAKLSGKIDIPAPTLTCWERGERTPSAQLFIQLHTKLNVNLNWLVTGSGSMFNTNETLQEAFKHELCSEIITLLEKNGYIRR